MKVVLRTLECVLGFSTESFDCDGSKGLKQGKASAALPAMRNILAFQAAGENAEAAGEAQDSVESVMLRQYFGYRLHRRIGIPEPIQSCGYGFFRAQLL